MIEDLVVVAWGCRGCGNVTFLVVLSAQPGHCRLCGSESAALMALGTVRLSKIKL